MSTIAGDAEPPRENRPSRPPSAERDALARAELEPLGENERPPALLVAVAVSTLLAVGVLVGGLTVHNLAKHGGSLPGALFLSAIFALLAIGMYRRRYLAVLGFEALIAFQVIVTSLALIVAATIEAAAFRLLAIGLGGWLFWKLVRVMGRIQAGEPDRRAQP
ncbi:MAG TPA: hypothetical protein VK765_04170 [Solirubrobacteraceae bacterium]|nr:hypothetical protein [Solirubrobacteraceae bacterium]